MCTLGKVRSGYARALIVFAALASLVAAGPAGAAVVIWTGVNSASWDDGNNWDALAVPGAFDDASFPDPVPGTGSTISLTAAQSVGSIYFNNSYRLTGADLTLNLGVINTGDNTTVRIDNVLAGTASLFKQGNGTLILTADNSAYSRSWNVDGGTLLLGHNAALGGAISSLTLAGGARLGSFGTGPITSDVIWTGNYNLTFAHGDLTLSATPSSIGSALNVSSLGFARAGLSAALNLAGHNLNLSGPGRITIGTASNTLSTGGAITINSSGSAGSVKKIAGNVDAGGSTLTIDGSGGVAIDGNILGGGALVKQGGGELILRGAANTHASSTVSGGKLVIAHADALGSGGVQLSGGTLQVGYSAQGLMGQFYNAVVGNGAMGDQLAYGRAVANAGWALAYSAPTTAGGGTSIDFRTNYNNQEGNIFGSLGFNRQYDHSAVFDGYLVVPTTGQYEFRIGSDDGTVLYINDQLVVNNDYWQGFTWRDNVATPISLTAGLNKITVGFYQGGGGAGMALEWRPQGSSTWQPMLNSSLRFDTAADFTPASYSVSNAVNVSGNSGVDLASMAAGGAAAFGAMWMADGASLTASGAGRTATFNGLTVSNGSAIGFGGDATINLGAVTGTPGSISRSGSGTVNYTGSITVGSGGLSFTGGAIAGGPMTLQGGITKTTVANARLETTSLNLDGGNRAVSVANGNLTITSPLSNGSVDKQGAGTLTLAPTAASSPTNVVVTQGTLELNGNAPVGSAQITLKNGAILVPGQISFTAGLNESWTSGDGAGGSLIASNRPDGTFIGAQLGPRRGQTNTVTGNPLTGWADNTTFIYKGRFYDADGYFAFAENIDDRAAVWIDGVLRLFNEGWNTPTSTGSTSNNGYGGVTYFGMGPDGDGWHDIEIRMSNGGGGAGSVGGDGWVGGSKGFGLRNATDSLDQTNGDYYVAPWDDGSGSLFRVVTGRTAATGLTANNVVVEADATINLADALNAGGSITMGDLSRPGPGTLTVIGANRTINFGNTALANADMGFAGSGNVNVGNLSPATTQIGALTKSGAGKVQYSGTLQVASITTSGGTIEGGDLALVGGSRAIAHTGTAAATIKASAFDLGGGTVPVSVTRVTNAVYDLTIDAPLSNGGLSKTGDGYLALKGSTNAFAGGVSSQGGKLALLGATAAGSGAITLDNTTLQVGDYAGQGLAVNLYTPDCGTGVINNWTNFNNWVGARTPVATAVTTAGGNTEMWFPASPPSGGYGGAAFAVLGFPQTDNFTLDFQGYIYVPETRVYTFRTGSDDGSSLFVDGQLVVNSDYYQGETFRSGSAMLTEGWHTIRVGFYEGGGDASLRVDWSLDGQVRLANTYLYRGVAPVAFTGGNDVSVLTSSTIDVTAASAAQFGQLAIASGATLTVNGVRVPAVFSSTILDPDGGTINVDGTGRIALGRLSASQTDPTSLYVSAGRTSIVGGSLNDLSLLAINVADNRPLEVVATPGTGNALGGATVNLGMGSRLLLSSTGAGTDPIIGTLNFSYNPVIGHSGPYTTILGDASHGLNLGGSTTLTFDTTGGTLIVAGAVPSDASEVVKRGKGTVLIAGAYNGGPVKIFGGAFGSGANNRFNTTSVTVNAGGTFTASSFTESVGTLRLNPEGWAEVGNGGSLTAATLQLNGGGIRINSGGTFVVPAAGLVPVGTSSPVLVLGEGVLDVSANSVFDVADGPHNIDMAVLATLSGSITKRGRGTLLLGGDNVGAGASVAFDASAGHPGAIGIVEPDALGPTTLVLSSTGATPYNARLMLLARGTLGADRVSVGDGVGTIDVSTATAIANARWEINGALGGTGQLVKTGWGVLHMGNVTSPPTTPSSTVVQQGTLALGSRTTALGAQPTIEVARGGQLITAAANLDLTNVTFNAWTHPSAPNWSSGAHLGWNYPGYEWYGSVLRIQSNMGNDATARFPTQAIRGLVHIDQTDLGRGGQLNNEAGGAYVPLMGHLSVLRHGGNNPGLNFRIDTNAVMFYQLTGNVEWHGKFTGDGGLWRIGGSELRLFADNDYTGKTIIDGGTTYLIDVNGKLSGSTDIRILSGTLQHDNWVAIVDKRFNDSATIAMYGGTFVYQGYNGGPTNAAGTAPTIDIRGGATINTNSPRTDNSATLTILNLTRQTGGTVNFLGRNLGLGGATDSTTWISGSNPISAVAITPWAYVNNADWAIYGANGVRAVPASWYGTLAAPGATGDVSISASAATTAATSINSLRMTGAGTLTIGNASGQHMTLASGGLLVNAAGTWTIDQPGVGSALRAHDGVGYKELIVNTNQQLTISAPIEAAGLAKSGGGRLILSAASGTNFNGGQITVNNNILEIREPTAINNAGEIVSNGGQIEFKSDSPGSVLFASDVRVTNSAISDRNIHVDRITGSGPTNVRHSVGALTIEDYVRAAQIRNANGMSLSFGNTTLGDGVYLNLDGAAANPWQFGVGGTVNLNGRVWLNLWSGDSEWGSLGGTGTEWAKSGPARMILTAPAQSGYQAEIEHTGGELRLAADGALGTGTGGNATTVNVRPLAYLNVATLQTVLPTINLSRYAAIGGSLGWDPAVYDGGANKINLPDEDAVYVGSSTLTPSLAARGANRDWLGIDSTSGMVYLDPVGSVYRGAAVGSFTPGGNIESDFWATSGDLAILMLEARTFRPNSPSTTQRFDTTSGVVNVFGPHGMTLASNGGNGVKGDFLFLNRWGDARTQNNDLMILSQGAAALSSGKTLNVYDGRLRIYDNSEAIAADAIVNVGPGATLLLHNVAVTSGTVNVLADERGFGVVWVNDIGRFTSSLSNLSFAPGSMIVYDTDANPQSSGLPSYVDYLVRDDNNQINTTALVLDGGRRLTTGWNDNGGISGTGGLQGPVAGAPAILSAGSGRRLAIWTSGTIDGLFQINDAAPVIVLEGDDMTRQLTDQIGIVEIDRATIASTAVINVVNGTLRFGQGGSNPGTAPVVHGLIDHSVRPNSYVGGGPYIEVHSGRDGNSANYVGGNGTVRLGRGEDISVFVNEVDNPGAGNPNKVNEFRVAVNVLGLSETDTLSLSGNRGAFTGLLRSARGDDRNGNFALARFTNVRPNAGAVVALSSWNDNRIMADFVLTHDPNGPNPIVISDRDEWGFVMIGNVTTLDNTERWLQIGINGGNMYGPTDYHMDLVGTLSGKANILMNSREMVRIMPVSLDNGATTYSSFNLNGRTLRLAGTGELEVQANPGVGVIEIAAAYRQSAGRRAIGMWYGRDGRTWGTEGSQRLDMTFTAGQYRTLTMFVQDAASGPGLVNDFTGSINAAAGASGVVEARRWGNADAVQGQVNTNLSLGENGILALRSFDNERLAVQTVALTGSGWLLNDTAGGAANITINRVAAQTGAESAVLSISGGQQTNIVGSGAAPAVQAGGIVAHSELAFNPGTGQTAGVEAPITLGNTKLVVKSGTVDMGARMIDTLPDRAAAAQPISSLEERFYRPSYVGLGPTGFNSYGGDPFIMFENATNFLNAPSANVGTLTGALSYANDAAMRTRAESYGSYPAEAGQSADDQIGAAWKGTITVGGAGNAIQPGLVSFGARSDDGTTVYIDLNGDNIFQADERIVDNRGPHGTEHTVASVALAAGTYNIAVGFFEGNGGAAAEVRWAPGAVADYWQMQVLDPSGTFAAFNPYSIVQVDNDATLAAGAIRVDELVIGEGAKVEIKATSGAASTSVVNLLQIANGSGGFSWDFGGLGGGAVAPAGELGGNGAAAPVPEPATWGLALLAVIAGWFVARRRR